MEKTIREWALIAMVDEKLDGDYKLDFIDVCKNNGVIRRGLQVKKEGTKVAPVIYVEEYTQDGIGYEEMEKAAAKIAEQIAEAFEDAVEIGAISDMSKEMVLKRVVFQVVNKERNFQMLKDAYNIDFLDMSIIYRCVLSNDETGVRSFVVKKGVFDITDEELFVAATENTEKFYNFFAKGMKDILIELGVPGEMFNDMDDETKGMYVAGSVQKGHGACVMLYKTYFDEIAEKTGCNDLLVFPSSIHEVIAVPYDGRIGIDDAIDMVKDINATEVPEEERLSDNVYIYKKDEGRFIVA